jgi:hypothetical protein
MFRFTTFDIIIGAVIILALLLLYAIKKDAWSRRDRHSKICDGTVELSCDHETHHCHCFKCGERWIEKCNCHEYRTTENNS